MGDADFVRALEERMRSEGVFSAPQGASLPQAAGAPRARLRSAIVAAGKQPQRPSARGAASVAAAKGARRSSHSRAHGKTDRSSTPPAQRRRFGVWGEQVGGSLSDLRDAAFSALEEADEYEEEYSSRGSGSPLPGELEYDSNS